MRFGFRAAPCCGGRACSSLMIGGGWQKAAQKDISGKIRPRSANEPSPGLDVSPLERGQVFERRTICAVDPTDTGLTHDEVLSSLEIGAFVHFQEPEPWWAEERFIDLHGAFARDVGERAHVARMRPTTVLGHHAMVCPSTPPPLLSWTAARPAISSFKKLPRSLRGHFFRNPCRPFNDIHSRPFFSSLRRYSGFWKEKNNFFQWVPLFCVEFFRAVLL